MLRTAIKTSINSHLRMQMKQVAQMKILISKD